MLRSSGIRFLIVGVLVAVMAIPLLIVAGVINERSEFSRATISAVGENWGGAQVVSGPVLIVPVNRVETRLEPDPEDTTAALRHEGIVSAEPAFIRPDLFEVSADLTTEIRKRGFFEVPVYSSTVQITFDYALEDIARLLTETETLMWDQARIEVGVGSNRALRGAVSLVGDDTDFPLTSRVSGNGFQAVIGDPRGYRSFTMDIGLSGAERLFITPEGRLSQVRLSGDWPHPSFQGGFLPDEHTVTNEGFSAQWSIPHLASSLPRLARISVAGKSQQGAFGVAFAQPNDFYQKSFRAARYGIMFVALTFLTVLLMDARGARPTHPVQYLLIGLSQSVFFLMLVAFAEQIGFGGAYALAAGATIVLLTLYGFIGLAMGARATALGALLVVLYGALYLILQSADFALLIGSVLAFGALAATMFVTRNEDWYGRIAPPRPAGPVSPAATPETDAHATGDP